MDLGPNSNAKASSKCMIAQTILMRPPSLYGVNVGVFSLHNNIQSVRDSGGDKAEESTSCRRFNRKQVRRLRIN